MKKNCFSLFIIIVLMVIYVMPSYSLEKKEKIVLYHDGIPSYAGTYPENAYKIDMREKKEGFASIRMMWNVPKGKWCGGEISGVHPKDVSPFLEKGMLKFWIKSDKKEKKGITVGLTDKNKYVVSQALNKYLEKVTPQWQEVIIPLSKFKSTGSYWDGNVGKKVYGAFSWDGVTSFTIDIGASDGDKDVVYLDHIEIVNPIEIEE